MSFADDFFGITFSNRELDLTLVREEIARRSSRTPEKKESVLRLEGHKLKNDAGEVVTKAITASGTEYLVVETREQVDPQKPSIVLNGLWEMKGSAPAMQGELHNRTEVRSGREKITNPIVILEIGPDQVFIPTGYDASPIGKVSAIRGQVFKRKPGGEPVV